MQIGRMWCQSLFLMLQDQEVLLLLMGVGIGQDEIHPSAALEITSSNYKALSLPIGDHREQNDAIAGSIMFSVVYESFMVYDGELWNRVKVNLK